MGIKHCPVNGDECTVGLVLQECHGQSKKHKPSRRIQEHVVYQKKGEYGDLILIETGYNDRKGESNDGVDEADDGVDYAGSQVEDEVGEAKAASDGADNEDDGDEDGGDDNEGDEGGGQRSDWDNGDSERGDAPEFLSCVSGERKIPPCTMNGTEGGGKGNQEQDVQVLGISVLWNVERGDVGGISREG